MRGTCVMNRKADRSEIGGLAKARAGNAAFISGRAIGLNLPEQGLRCFKFVIFGLDRQHVTREVFDTPRQGCK